ncbi:hypothetical protein [Runella sp.]|uniref:hypothetical protein n=1 Tax=Runella sp. TaxID=1960881 RepID=UPI00261B1C87|nr:hypothetical protein [Runella sp.]
MTNITYDTAAKQFMLAYSYTNAKGRMFNVAPKPRGLTALTNQVLKAQQRLIIEFVANITSQDLSTLDAVATVTGSGSNFIVAIIGYGGEASNWSTVGEALRELVRLGKEYSDPNFRKALRKKRFSLTLGA